MKREEREREKVNFFRFVNLHHQNVSKERKKEREKDVDCFVI